MTQFDELAAPLLVRQRRSGNQSTLGDAGPLVPPGAASILQLQRTVGNAAVVAQLSEESEDDRPITKVVADGGQPLDRGTKAQMERAFGHDFSDVRIHDDSAASAAAHDVSAKAATVGSHIVFRSGEFNPSTSQGQHLLAHELTHVVQQRSGPVDGTSAGGGVKISDPSDRFETAAEANASAITSQLSADPTLLAAGAGVVAESAAVQRDESDEGDDEVQAMTDWSIQRETEEDEGEMEA